MMEDCLNTINEIWKPIKNCDYMISNMGNVINKNTNEPVELYKSTNGYDYIYLKLGDDEVNKLYPLHHILATIFIDKPDPCLPNTRALFKDIKNGCCVDNIYWGVEKEIWKPVTTPTVVPGRYKVSNFGNIYNMKKSCMVKPNINPNGYKVVYLTTTGGDISKNTHTFKLHRIVATAFCGKIDESHNIVNHIDGNKLNNHYMNLEWVTQKMNLKHSYILGLSHVGEDLYNSKMTNAEAEKICKLLVDNNFSAVKVFEIINNENNNNITIDMVKSIKEKHSWKHISDLYFTREDINENKKNSEKIIHEICKLLVDNNFESKTVFEIVNKTNPSISYDVVSQIRNKQNWRHISDLYFTDDDFEKKKPIDESIVHEICKSLKENNFSSIDTFNKIKDKYPDVTIHIVTQIKLKLRWKHISDLYFTANDYKKRTRMDEETVHEICKMFVDNDLDLIKVYNMVKDRGISYDAVSKIKYKKNWKHISDLYF